MNFKSATTLYYKGNNGQIGLNGKDGTIPIIFRDGKPGEAGGNGTDGEVGKKIIVHVKKEYDKVFDKEIFFVYAFDSITSATHIYRSLYPEKGIEINVCGGDGGAGGSGGDGSRGKAANEGKTAGDGGDGGFAGNGGNGAKGGKAIVIAHTNASEILGYLRIDNSGGVAGAFGRGGAAGAGGGGSSSGRIGKSGGNGNAGLPGEHGPNFELKVEEF